MPVTLTIKQVPDRTVEKLRLRAAANHRSLQGELMVILEAAVLQSAAQARREPSPPASVAKRAAKPARRKITAYHKRLSERTVGALAPPWARFEE